MVFYVIIIILWEAFEKIRNINCSLTTVLRHELNSGQANRPQLVNAPQLPVQKKKKN